MRTMAALALAVALLAIPLSIPQWDSGDFGTAPAAESAAGPDDNPLPWFLTDVVIPDPLPPGAVLPSWAYEPAEGEQDISSIPDFNAMTITDEQLEGPAQARTVYPLLNNMSLSVSFEWDASVGEFQDMEGGLRRFANLVYDYTDGQFTVGSFQIYNNKANWNSVNIHVLAQSWYRANANPGGYYYGGIIQVGKDAWGQAWNTPMGAVTLAHEFGHYGLMLPDEYIEATQEPRCNNNTAGTCIMSDPYSYFELCTAESHNAVSTGDAHSCWYYIKYYYPDVTEVHGVPDPGPTSGPVPTVTWHYPDLWVSSQQMTASALAPNEGMNVTLSVPVHNGERLVGATVTVRFYVDSAISAKMIKAVYLNMAGQDAPAASCSWQAVGGTHSIIVVVDPDNQVREQDDHNNQASRQLTVNARPRISSALTGFTSREDIPLTMKMTQYATDAEDAASSLRWSVVKMDAHALVSVAGQGGPNQTLTFNPVTHWSGTTSIILGVTDSGNLMAQKEIELAFTFFNYPPQPMDASVSPASVLRGRSVEVTSGASDVEDRESQLTPLFEWRPNGSDEWKAIAAYFDGARFKAVLTVPADTHTGKADLRVCFQDTLGNRGQWADLNSSLDVKNNRPQIADIGLSETAVTRGGLVTVFVNASDVETAADGLSPALECRGADGWVPLGVEGEYVDGSWSFQLDVGANWSTGAQDLRAIVRDPDGGASEWWELSDALVVINSDPVMNSARAVRTRMLRNESCAVTVTGEDYETPASNLTIEFRAQDPRGKDQPGYITRSRWVNGSWETTFLPPPMAAAGKYTLSARIGDTDGGWSAWKDMPSTVDVGNNIPSAGFSCPETAVQGDIVRFDGASSFDIEDPLNLLTLNWNFGDGSSPGIGQLATHAFPRAGTFRVTLTVTDRDGGTATAFRTISIAERPAAPMTGGEAGTWLSIASIVIVVAAAAGAYVFMKKKKASGRASQPAAASARVAAPQAPMQYVPLASPAGPSPGPYPMPGPGPDPLRPAEPEPMPYPQPEPDDDGD